MKKLVIFSVAFVFAFSASIAFAGNCHQCNHPQQGDDCCPNVEVDAWNGSVVTNIVKTVANTGKNFVTSCWGGNGVDSGNATAKSIVENYVGTNQVEVNMPDRGSVDVSAGNSSAVFTLAGTVANSGKNSVWKSGWVGTGAANAAAEIYNYIGTNVVKIK